MFQQDTPYVIQIPKEFSTCFIPPCTSFARNEWTEIKERLKMQYGPCFPIYFAREQEEDQT